MFAYLTSRVDDLRREVLPLMLDDAAESVLNRRIVALDKVVFDEADGERGFPYIRQLDEFIRRINHKQQQSKQHSF